MATKAKRKKAAGRIAIEPGSGNVFADLGLPQPEKRLAEAELARVSHARVNEKDRNPQRQATRDRVPDAVRQRFDEIVGLIQDVCQTHLTEEYAALARELATALARKRPSPLLQGRVPTWACGITYTLGTVNFLFDHTQTPHLSGRDLYALFGVSLSAGSAKAREIMRLMRIVQLDPQWCLPSRLSDNPLVWMLEVNGIVVDVRMMPRDFQEEAHRLGLIPFVPTS